MTHARASRGFPPRAGPSRCPRRRRARAGRPRCRTIPPSARSRSRRRPRSRSRAGSARRRGAGARRRDPSRRIDASSGSSACSSTKRAIPSSTSGKGGTRRDELEQLGLGRRQRLRALELGHVEHVALRADGRPVLVAHQHPLVAQPHDAAVAMQDAVLDLRAIAALEHARRLLHHPLAIVGVQDAAGRSRGSTTSPPACSRARRRSAGSRTGWASRPPARRCRRSAGGPRRGRDSCRQRAAAVHRAVRRSRRHERDRRGSSYMASIGRLHPLLEVAGVPITRASPIGLPRSGDGAGTEISRTSDSGAMDVAVERQQEDLRAWNPGSSSCGCSDRRRHRRLVLEHRRRRDALRVVGSEPVPRQALAVVVLLGRADERDAGNRRLAERRRLRPPLQEDQPPARRRGRQRRGRQGAVVDALHRGRRAQAQDARRHATRSGRPSTPTTAPPCTSRRASHPARTGAATRRTSSRARSPSTSPTSAPSAPTSAAPGS